jgi:hypothetical protein
VCKVWITCYFKHQCLGGLSDHLTLVMVLSSCLPRCVLVRRYAVGNGEERWDSALVGSSHPRSKHPPTIVSVARSKQATVTRTTRQPSLPAGKTKKHKPKRLKKS